ncbi:MAG: transketolase [Firmicutes bacterium]|nr:transketolase [Bacillota bacterium]
MENKLIEEKAKEIRREIIKMLGEAKSGHPGGSLSGADIIAALYYKEMKLDPSNPKWEDRDRFVMSKGHAAPLLYSVLALKGYFDIDILKTLRKTGSILQGHPDMNKVPGVEMSTGSLGQGFSTAVGMALSFKIYSKENRVYALLGDGECQEGIVWEAAMSAAHYNLDNLVAILDNNGLQIDGKCSEVMCLGSLQNKWKSFGFHVIEIDGHNIEQIIKALDEARTIKDKPTLILAKTIKGKGVSFMEDRAEWHGAAPNMDQVALALEELK